MAWSPGQDAALRAVSAWVKRGEPQVFRMFGYAGTGKTTLAKQIAEDISGTVAFAAYTGKAALMLRSKGCRGASTIHSMIYRPREDEEEGVPSFSLNRQGSAADADLIVIDECSMVDEDLGRDLLSFGKPVLVLGDSAQLPPVKGGGFFTEAEPDVMLTEVHRQAADNPIIHMSMQVRAGQRLSLGQYGESRVVRRSDIGAPSVMQADQVLVGINKTRRAYNGRMRELLGHRGAQPEVGEKLVCLRNDKKKGLLNGGTFTVAKLHQSRGAKYSMSVTPEDEADRKAVRIGVLPEFFTGREDSLLPDARRESDQFDFGYALTVHKAQGSQWDEVMLFDESFAFREHRDRWLYTGLTRAAKKITIVL